MSGRIRSVKPEWLEDERMALASAEARVLSIAFMLLADDYGRGRASRTMLIGRVFPGKPPETLAKALEELAGWFVTLYEVDGQSYFEIKNWEKHQKVDKPGKPKVPPPCDTLEKLPEDMENLRASRASLPLPDPIPDPESGPVASHSRTQASAGRPTAEDLMSPGPGGRADVNRVHEAYKLAFGLTDRKFRGAFDLDAKTIAEAIGTHGEETCLLVVKHAPDDGMVSGRDDDKRVKHFKIGYIFGNEDTFARILKRARDQERDKSSSAVDDFRRRKEARP